MDYHLHQVHESRYREIVSNTKKLGMKLPGLSIKNIAQPICLRKFPKVSHPLNVLGVAWVYQRTSKDWLQRKARDYILNRARKDLAKFHLSGNFITMAFGR